MRKPQTTKAARERHHEANMTKKLRGIAERHRTVAQDARKELIRLVFTTDPEKLPPALKKQRLLIDRSMDQAEHLDEMANDRKEARLAGRRAARKRRRRFVFEEYFQDMALVQHQRLEHVPNHVQRLRDGEE